MSEISINTTQNVNINFIPADIGVRLLAYIIDLFVKLAYMYAINVFVLSPLGIYDFEMDTFSTMGIQILFYLPIMFYSIASESLMEGQSVGKKVMKIKVVKIDGYQASIFDYLIRWVFRLIDITGTACVAGLTAMTINKYHQRLGDIAAGTAVIALKSNINISHTILVELVEDYIPTYPQVINFSDNDMRIIKETYLTAKKNNDYTTLSKLVKKIESVGNFKSEGSDATFIATVIKDYNYYTGMG
jgi:uncharacterized RDD family membrane protein YckC